VLERGVLCEGEFTRKRGGKGLEKEKRLRGSLVKKEEWARGKKTVWEGGMSERLIKRILSLRKGRKE